MSDWTAFILSVGGWFVVVSLIAAEFLRAPKFALKIALMLGLIGLAIYLPRSIAPMMGRPSVVTFASLPARSVIVGSVEHDGGTRAALWLQVGDALPRAYDVEMTDKLREILKKSEKDKEEGRPTFLTVSAKPHRDHRPNGNAIFGTDYDVDSSRPSLPEKVD